MVLIGPEWLRLAFQGFVVVVGILIPSAAANTSIIGSNGVMNRVAEDGVLPEWFREPHKRYGTTYRIIAIVAVLQIATVIISQGDVTLLGEAYAFGIAWSFAMKASRCRGTGRWLHGDPPRERNGTGDACGAGHAPAARDPRSRRDAWR